MTKSAIVIGAGFGGLALAIRLQSAGVQTTIVEARDKPGGRAYVWEKDGFTFDAGPTVITAPETLRGTVGAVGPRHGRRRDAGAGQPLLPAELARRHELRLYQRRRVAARRDRQARSRRHRGLCAVPEVFGEGVYREGYEKLGHVAFLDFKSMLTAAPSLAQVSGVAIGLCDGLELREEREAAAQALSFHTLLVGGNPMTTSAIYALIHKLERDGGVWFAQGGTNRLVAGMVRHFERLGGVLRLNAPVESIDTLGDRATGVTLAVGRDDDGRCGRVERRPRPDLSHAAARRRARASAPPRSWSASGSRRRCSSSISGSRGRGRASRTT